MTVTGIAGFYLSDPSAEAPAVAPLVKQVIAELRPTITPILTTFRLWRRAVRIATRTE